MGYATDDDCGCDFIEHVDVDGRQVEQHHHWPDDGAPHAETADCGCGPSLQQVTETLWVYHHVDQDEVYPAATVMVSGIGRY